MLTGLDQVSNNELSALRRRVRGARLGILTHAASVDRRGRHVLAVLDELGATPRLIFAPEHGLDAVAQAEEAVPSSPSVDELGASAPVVSLYGASKADLSPSAEHLADIDLLLIDLCDVGARYYTYLWTALLALRAAASAGVHTVVLDRPNPISGDPASIEGGPQREGFLSLVGLEPLPIRHALTLAEALAFFCQRDGLELGPEGAVSTVPVRGWERLRGAEAWGRPFVIPSPNMPSVETALVYPGGCLIEGTNLSEGRGTTVPFQTVGAPFLDGAELARRLTETGIPGAFIRPVAFRPSFDKHAGQRCQGVMVHVTNPRLFRPVATYLALICLARNQAPDAFAFRETTYEFEAEVLAFDLLTGSDQARGAILQGAEPEDVISLVAPVESSWQQVVADAETLVATASA